MGPATPTAVTSRGIVHAGPRSSDPGLWLVVAAEVERECCGEFADAFVDHANVQFADQYQDAGAVPARRFATICATEFTPDASAPVSPMSTTNRWILDPTPSRRA